jgi:hypothetical protein
MGQNRPKLRHELKYYINHFQYLEFQRRLQVIMQRDAFTTAGGGYHVRSLYFDDIDNTALFEKDAGVFRRDKYRIRIYNKSDSPIKLERKSKYGQYIGKEAASLNRFQYDQIMANDITFLLKSGNRLMIDFYFLYVNRLMRPKVIVDYDREAYVCKNGEVRITFDKMVRAGMNSNDIFTSNLVTVNVFQEPVMILEVKYNEFLPENIRMLFQTTGPRSIAFSKYVICRELKNNI